MVIMKKQNKLGLEKIVALPPPNKNPNEPIEIHIEIIQKVCNVLISP